MALNNEAVLKTLIYADIFSFPLTLPEICFYLISPSPKTSNDVKESLNFLLKTGLVYEHEGFFGFLKNPKNALKRVKAKAYQGEKVKKAVKAAQILSKIPSVLFVGISGGVAVGNVGEDDDIDLFVITEKNSIWETRLLCVMNLSKYGLRRSRNDYNVKDKICLNMFLTEDSLKNSIEKQDIYTAHEIAQLQPLFSRKETYEKFIQDNSWITDYLANFRQKKPLITNLGKTERKYEALYNPLSQKAIKFLQVLYMKTHVTKETISDNVLAFHPKDYRETVLSSYKKKLLQYNLSDNNEKI